MTNDTTMKELAKGRAYLVKMGGVEILALKLEGFKATQLEAALSPMAVDIGGKQAESNDWLMIVKTKDQIAMPYDVWARQVALGISKATGSSISTISVATSGDIVTAGSADVRKDKKS